MQPGAGQRTLAFMCLEPDVCDSLDECDALRKLAVAQRKVGDPKEVESAARRAASLSSDDDQRTECVDFLAAIRQAVDKATAAKFALAIVARYTSSATRDTRATRRRLLISSKCRGDGWISRMNAQEKNNVDAHYTVYFHLVYKYGCAPVAEIARNSAVVNVDECI